MSPPASRPAPAPPAPTEAALRRALALQPGEARLHGQLGELLYARGDIDGAEACYRRAAELAPGQPLALRKLVSLLYAASRWSEAEEACRQLLAIAPGDADTWSNLGAVLRLRYALDEAQQALGHALALQPAHARARTNLAALLTDIGRDEEAAALFRQALADAPGDPVARMNLGMVLLRLGQYAEGLPLFEARYVPRPHQPHAYATPPLPRWQGEDLAGKSLALWFEQGFGDALQFIRYVPLLRARGLRQLTLVGPPVLRELLATVEGIDAVVVPGEQIRRHDYWCLLMSLPLHCGTTLHTLPATLPYLHADPTRVAEWSPRLPPGRKVGLVWKGAAIHANDQHRSLPGLAALRPLWDVPGIAWISLQKGQAEDEALAPPAGQSLLPLGSAISDFAEMAAVVAQLDLVICVDTAIAHLAGALGKPAWVLLPDFASDWRWLRGRADSPWYPGVLRLFRQPAPGDWAPVVAEVAHALAQRFGASTDRQGTQVDQWIARATELRDAGQADQAEAAVRRALALQPRSLAARQLLASLRPVGRAALRRPAD